MKRRFLLCLLLASGVSALVVSALSAQSPVLTVASASAPQPGVWILQQLPPLLHDDELRQQLDTGLTTSLVFRLSWRDVSGAKIEGGARAQVRYELWDELYEVAVIDGAGQLRRFRLASFEALEGWWRELQIVVLVPPPGASVAAGQGSRTTARVSLDVVPFSRAEQQDAQRWFSESLENAGRGNTEEVARSVDEQPEKLSKVLGLLMSTSIQRRAIMSHRWNVVPTAQGTP